MQKIRPRILCVDDEVQNLALLSAVLMPEGYEVIEAQNGEEALKKIRTEQVDIVLLDVMMPGMDGFAVVRELKRDLDLSSVPVVIFSGKPKETMIELFGPEGIAGYISKPYDPKELVSQIQNLIGS